MDDISQMNSAENDFVYVIILVLPVFWKGRKGQKMSKRLSQNSVQAFCATQVDQV